jgi:CRISPR-associated protein Csx10
MRLSMRLVTDAVPASGEGVAGIIDTDIVYDEHGIPYIPARRIKGVLRESALMLVEAERRCGQREASDRVGEVFGLPGMSESSSLRLSDGYPAGWLSLRDSLAWTKAMHDSRGAIRELVSPEAVLDYFTYLHTRTAIDSSTGTAKENTLRVERVLRAGLVFEFDLRCPASFLELIRRSVAVTRSFGLGRTRGVGLISMALSGEPSPVSATLIEDTECPGNDGTACQTLEFTICNTEPLLTSRNVGIHTISDFVIPGAAMLGAVAGQYLRGRGLPSSTAHMDEEFRRLFLDGEVTFSDLLPVDDQYRYVPAPLSVLHIKDLDRVADMSDARTRQEFVDKEVKGHIAEHVALEPTGDGLECFKRSVRTQVDAHHRRPLDKSVGRATQEDDSDFYQFEVLSSGQLFGGSITGPRQLLARIQSSLTPGKEIFLGKSKAAEYGKCQVVRSEFDSDNLARWSFRNDEPVSALSCLWDTSDGGAWSRHSVVRAWALSDIVLRDSSGVCRPDPQLLAAEIGRNVGSDGVVAMNDDEENYSFVETAYVGGYNAKWRLPIQQVPALARGSVVLLRNDGPDIPYERLAGVLYGERTSEGCGRVLFMDHAMNMDVQSSHGPGQSPEPKIEDKGSVAELFAFLFNRSMDRSIRTWVAEKALREGSGQLGGSLRRFADIVDGAGSFEELLKQLRQLQGPSRTALNEVSKDHLFLGTFFEPESPENVATIRRRFGEFVANSRPPALDVPGAEEFLTRKLDLSMENLLEPTWDRYRLYIKTLVRRFQLESRGTKAKASSRSTDKEVAK